MSTGTVAYIVPVDMGTNNRQFLRPLLVVFDFTGRQVIDDALQPIKDMNI